MHDIGVSCTTIPLNPVVAGGWSFRTLWTELPLEIAFYTRPEFQQAVDRILNTESIDLAISFFMRTAEYIRTHPELPRVLVAEDCRVEYQSRSASESRSPLQRIVRWWETRKLLRYEPRVVEDFAVTTFVSDEDVAAMRDLNPHRPYAVVTNGVDLDRFSYQADQERRSGVLFAGKLDVQANHLMASSVIEDIFPMVRVLRPEATLTIAGARPLPALRSMISDGMQLDADVPDLVPYLHEHAVFLHPHRGGSGIQNKVLEAMSAGCAVVTTPSGLQGIEASHGIHCLVAERAADMADHVATLLGDPDQRRRLAENARELMVQTHSWEHVYDQIDGVIDVVSRAQGRSMTPALFLDRDGVINRRIIDGYVQTVDEFDLLPDILPILTTAKEHGYVLVLITNQQGVGKGLMTAADLDVVHGHMQNQLRRDIGFGLDAIYSCTSLASDNDPRRKPAPGMLLEAIDDLDLDPNRSWFLGDSVTDATAGRAAGVKTILVGEHPAAAADIVVPTLADVVLPRP